MDRGRVRTPFLRGAADRRLLSLLRLNPLDSAGNLYGTAQYGGAHGEESVFELSPEGDGTWTETILHTFQKDASDGFWPYGGLIFDSAGNPYGTTTAGGATEGTVYELSPIGNGTWTEKVLHSFGNGTDGKYPSNRALVVDRARNLYGTTGIGGKYDGGTGVRSYALAFPVHRAQNERTSQR
jgi:uncharacterized repeat protein (TIGR03803 family)